MKEQKIEDTFTWKRNVAKITRRNHSISRNRNTKEGLYLGKEIFFSVEECFIFNILLVSGIQNNDSIFL